MKIICTVEFNGVPDGQIHGKTFSPGDEVLGDLAKVAVSQKWAKEVNDESVKPEPKKAEPKVKA